MMKGAQGRRTQGRKDAGTQEHAKDEEMMQAYHPINLLCYNTF